MTGPVAKAVVTETVHTVGHEENLRVAITWEMHLRLARPTGVEPVTFGFGGQHSIQLSYGRVRANYTESASHLP
jgi:hypothetical protein